MSLNTSGGIGPTIKAPQSKHPSMPTGSPGDGVTPTLLSREPLATEGEASPGPDGENPYEALEDQREQERFAGEMATFDEPKAQMPEFDDPEETPLLFADFDFPDLW